NSEPRSHVNDCRNTEGSRFTSLVSARMTVFVSFPSTFTSTVKRDRRSTSVAIWVLPEPDIRSPSQCPGIALSSTSGGRSLIETASIIRPLANPLSFDVVTAETPGQSANDIPALFSIHPEPGYTDFYRSFHGIHA